MENLHRKKEGQHFRRGSNRSKALGTVINSLPKGTDREEEKRGIWFKQVRRGQPKET